jgi:hypothetical protein
MSETDGTWRQWKAALNNNKRRTIMVLYSFTCSDQRARSPFTRFACTDTITNTLWTHTQHTEPNDSNTRHTSAPTAAFLRLLGAVLYSATISGPSPPPADVMPRHTPRRVSRPEHHNPCVDLPRSIGNHATSGRRYLCRRAALRFNRFALRPDAWRHRRTRSLQQFNSASYTLM